MILSSIDVGWKGGIAIFNDDKLVSVHKMPVIIEKKKINKKVKNKYSIDLHKLYGLLYGSDYIIIENVHSFPKEGSVSAFNFGFQKGILYGMAFTITDEVYFVSPQYWKKYFKLSKNKNDSIKKVEELFNLKLKKSEDGLAEAILIGKYFIDNKLNNGGVKC